MTHEPGTLRPLIEFIPTRRVIVEWTVLGMGLTLVAGFMFSAVYAVGTGQTDVGFQVNGFESMLVELVWVTVLIVTVLGLHEAIHAAVIRQYGGDVSFGLGIAQFVLPYAYVTTTEQLDRNQFVAVALAPLVVITVMGVPLMLAMDAAVLIIPLALNAGGAIGDLWMVGVLLQYPSHVVVEDSVTGMTLYGRPDDELLSVTERGFLKRAVVGTGVGFGILLFAAILSPIVLGVLGVHSFELGLPNSPWSVYAFEGSAVGFEVNTNPIGLAAGSILLGCIYAFVTSLRTRTS